jgi:arylsulfatase A-like enzyme
LTIPLLLHWPGVLTPAVVGPGARAGDGGAVVTTPAIMMDLTATLLELTGLNSASSSSSSSSGGADTVEIDGVSLLPEIDVALGATPADDAATETDEERVFFWRLDLPPSESWGSGARRAVRRGRWKCAYTRSPSSDSLADRQFTCSQQLTTVTSLPCAPLLCCVLLRIMLRRYLWDGGFGYLFDLATDPAEHVNVYSRHDALARELEALSLSDW